MIRYTNECCGCATENYPCLGQACSNRNVIRFYCDACNNEVNELRDFDGEQLCNDCLMKNFRVIEE